LGNPSRGNLAVLASASLPNGTIVASLGVADVSYVLPEKEWSSGDYGALGGWCGSEIEEGAYFQYSFPLNDFFVFKTAPAHYGCGVSTRTSDATWAPGIYWSNAVPDAEARASFTFADGTKLSFDGRGYHDSNWGISPLFKNMIGEYWGHAALGPFSVVWSLVIGVDGKNYTSAYVSRNGVVLASSCQPTDFTMTVQGGATFPPTIPTQVKTSSFGLSFVLPNGDGVLDVVVNKLAIAMLGGKGVFIRWTGSAKGGIRGSNAFDGVAFSESFALLASTPSSTIITSAQTRSSSTFTQSINNIQASAAMFHNLSTLLAVIIAMVV
ncbi:hypothetical protein HDU99_008429, partial [Rhizoclosmatium hyalinum]